MSSGLPMKLAGGVWTMIRIHTDLDQWGAKFGNPTIFVSLVEWAYRVITE